MRILKALSASVLMFGATLALADPPAQVGRLNYLSGVVSFAPAEANTDWGAAVLNRPLTSGDRLWVDADGRAEMHVGSTAIRIPASTSLDVMRLDDSGTQLRLAQGSVNVRLRRLDAGDNFEISTPVGAVLFTQPGSYRVIVDPSGMVITVVVHRGQADVLTGGTPFTVRDRQLATVSGSGPQLYAAPPMDEFDNWSMARDGREDNLAATRYVPQEMTGYEDLDQYGTWRSEEQYGTVWYPTAVAADWAPYRHGHWVWISPWGWSWVDDAPWGFAPSHYGRWVWLRNRWGWAPGARVARPVYAPALVAFIGGTNWSVAVGSGPAVGWVPLGWREPYIPWYRSSPAYLRNVNVTHVTNIGVINQYSNVRNVNNIRYVNRGVPSATTVVAREAFVSGRRADRAAVNVPAQALANARITHEVPVARPERVSPMASRPRAESPDVMTAREAAAGKAPPARVDGGGNTGNGRAPFAQNNDRARERVIDPQQRMDAPTQQPATRTPVAPPQAPQAQQRAQQNEQQRQQQQEERQRQQQRSQAEQQALQRALQEDRQRQLQQQRVQQQQKQRDQQVEQQRQLQQQRSQAEQQARQRVQQDESQRRLQQQRAQQQKDQVQQEERQRQSAQQQARQNQAQQQRAQQEQQQQRMQQERVQREQRQAERAPESRPQPQRQSRDQSARGPDK